MNMHASTDVRHKTTLRLEPRDFAIAFDDSISGYVADRIKEFDFEYRPIPAFERDQWLRIAVKELVEEALPCSGEHRMPVWERGWSENLNGSLVPKYFGKFPVVRWCREFIAPADRRFEYEAFGVIKDWLFDKYFRDAENIHEFGCGTGHNLINAHRVNPRAYLHGHDWVDISRILIMRNWELFGNRASGHLFNFFDPASWRPIAPHSAIFTAAALEQTGLRYPLFIDWLIESEPDVVIHIEPINELLDPNNLMDYLSIRYATKRGYLSGLLDHLRQIEKAGRIEILTAKRTGIGSLFLDGYSVIVWRPK